tara:strand:+ start:6121 stop:6360 length:240 start_codon:yes stop_codon:yes gene_type:complete
VELKTLISNSEQRIVSYKTILGEVHSDKVGFPPDHEFVIEYKASLREAKNQEQVYLKELVEERTNENEGLNPPFCYPLK